MADPRLAEAVVLFNQGEWYACHDGFEALWHETAGPMRPVLQGILQLAVAQLHLQRGNQRGALVLTGEGLGRLARCPADALGLDLSALCNSGRQWLLWLQGQAPSHGATPIAELPEDSATAPAPAQPRLDPSACVQPGLSTASPPA
jgi:predicted metal-dependent hydrolase